MVRKFKELLADDELIRIFTLSRVATPVMVDMFGLAGGYHGFWIDQEHAGVSTDQIVVSAMAARANDFDCFVRIPPGGYWMVSRALESGAGGVMLAQIQSAEHALECFRWTKYAPQGVRGFNTSSRDAHYTHKPPAQYVQDANREHFVAIQIETLGAVDDAEAIAAIDGVDLLFIGPADLALTQGIVGQYQHEKLWEAIDHVAAACRKHGKHWGTVPADPQFADRAVGSGCRMLTLGNDIKAIKAGIEAIQQAFGSQF